LVGRGWAVVFARAGHDVRLFDVTEKKIAVARIWNGSTEASIAQLLVEFSYLSFGVGTSLHHIGVSKINLGVKGAPDQPSFATHQWLTPPTSGHYCVQVSLNWADDVNPTTILVKRTQMLSRPNRPPSSSFSSGTVPSDGSNIDLK
jgi:hypothetical protein